MVQSGQIVSFSGTTAAVDRTFPDGRRLVYVNIATTTCQSPADRGRHDTCSAPTTAGAHSFVYRDVTTFTRKCKWVALVRTGVDMHARVLQTKEPLVRRNRKNHTLISPWKRAAALGVVAVLALGACGGDDDDDDAAENETADSAAFCDAYVEANNATSSGEGDPTPAFEAAQAAAPKRSRRTLPPSLRRPRPPRRRTSRRPSSSMPTCRGRIRRGQLRLRDDRGHGPRVRVRGPPRRGNRRHGPREVHQ